MSAIKYELQTSADPTVTRIIPELAVEIGLNESIVLLQVAHWIKVGNNEQDGEYWTFQSVRDMHEKAFGYWSVDTVARTVNKLLKAKYLKARADLNQRKSDKTRWFALNVEKLSELKSISIIQVAEKKIAKAVRPDAVRKSDTTPQDRTAEPQNQTGKPQNQTTLPEITRDNTENQQQQPELPRIYSVYVENMRQQITPIIRDKLVDAVKEFGEPWVEDAIKEAVTHNAKTWAYVESVLDSWAKNGRDSPRPSLVKGAGITVSPPTVTASDALRDALEADYAS